MLTIIGAVLAFALGIWITSRYGQHIIYKNREVERERNKSGEVSKQELDWAIIHIRDDVGLIASSLALIVGLLSALIAIILTK